MRASRALSGIVCLVLSVAAAACGAASGGTEGPTTDAAAGGAPLPLPPAPADGVPDARAVLARHLPLAAALPDEPLPVLGSGNDLRAALGAEELRLLVRWRELESAPVARSLGAVYAQAEECNRALGWLARALELDPADPEAWYWLGVSHLMLGRPRETLALLERARALGHDGANVHQYLGDAHAALGEPFLAEAAYREAVARDPDDWEARLGLAALLEDDGRLEQARAHLRHLAVLDDEHPTPHFRLARVERALGDEPAALEAERLHRRAAILDDMRMRGARHSDVQKHLAAGWHLNAQGRFSEARAEYEAAFTRADDPGLRDSALAGIRSCDAGLAQASFPRGTRPRSDL